MRPNADGLIIDPAIPSDWDEITIDKLFRGKKLNITIENPQHVESGIKSITLNGNTLSGKLIPASELKDDNTVTIILG